ncbi:MAG: HD domain-containing protein [Myxococcota bacterium]
MSTAFAAPRHAALWSLVEPTLAEDTDLAHDAEHVLRVYRWAIRLAADAGVSPDLAGAAALVHDLVNIPKESADRPLGSELSAAAGAEVLPRAGYGSDEVAAVVEAVRTCSWSRGRSPTSALGAVLQDADRLDAIGAVGIARNFACAQAMASRGVSGRFYDPVDPIAQADRPLDDRRNAADHYRVKLLKLADTMHTPAARAEAAKRHAFMVAFLDQLAHEASS